MGICDNRVVIVTGAGGGLGRQYALAFAAEGAKVVVNDINQAAADETVKLIKQAGGQAIANTSNITNYADSANAVKQAIEAFGDLHVVVNNAGICRDKMFASMGEADWDAVIAVHLKGHFCISSHAVQHWRNQSKEGKQVKARIINTSSGAGLQGSIGQSNYSAAKGGIASLTLVQAAELGRYGVTANALAPSARTGMTENVFADMMKNSISDSINTLKTGEMMSARAITGEASLPDVVQAVNAAELTLQTVTAVRDRLVNAYQELMRTQM